MRTNIIAEKKIRTDKMMIIFYYMYLVYNIIENAFRFDKTNLQIE